MGGMAVCLYALMEAWRWVCGNADGRKEQSGRGEKGKGTDEMVARDRI